MAGIPRGPRYTNAQAGEPLENSRGEERPYFVDTNVLVYARDASEVEKQRSAEAWLRRLWTDRSGRVSAQVLNEYYVAVTEKLKPGLDREQARADVRNLTSWRPVPLDTAVTQGAWDIQDRYGLSWWDSLVVSAAQVAGCAYLLTEDLQHGRVFDGVQVVDPFRTLPSA
jgi:predicted nucleic acid-binding protein